MKQDDYDECKRKEEVFTPETEKVVKICGEKNSYTLTELQNLTAYRVRWFWKDEVPCWLKVKDRRSDELGDSYEGIITRGKIAADDVIPGGKKA